MNGKNIVYVIENIALGGGAERIISDKANILFTQYGYKITIISIYEDVREASYPLDDSINVVRLNVPMATKNRNALSTFVSRIATLLKAAKRLNKAIKDICPDIIFFATTLSALLLPLCKGNAIKIYESHLARMFNPYNKLFGIMERCADMIICLTKGDKMEYQHAKKIEIIPNFIDIPLSYVKDYNVKKAIAVGRLEYQKGFDILIDSWKDVSEVFPDWHLDIYGEGSQNEKLQQQIDNLHLNEKIKLCGRCDNMIEKYTEYSIHIMTSRYEGLPMTLIEAQACGLPSVVFDFKYGASDIIKDGVNGFLIKQGDKSHFTKQLINMMNNPHLRMKQGKEARYEAIKFSRENIMRKWANLLNNLV